MHALRPFAAGTYADSWELFTNRLGCLDPVHPGHFEIHQHQVGLRCSCQLDRIASSVGNANHLDVSDAFQNGA
jgi:hypothetical protein